MKTTNATYESKMFIIALILTASFTFKLTGANVAIHNRGNGTVECGKQTTLSCIFQKTFAIEWTLADGYTPIVKCTNQICRLNKEYVEQYNISYNMTQGFVNLKVRKVTMEHNGKKLLCSDGNITASYSIIVRDYEPTLIENKKSGTIEAMSGCISQDTQVSFKWMKILAGTEMEFNPKIKVKSNTRCTNDSDCGKDTQVHYSETIAAKASSGGDCYLKVIAMYGNESKESFSSNDSVMKYVIKEQDEEQLNSYGIYIDARLLGCFLPILAAAVLVYFFFRIRCHIWKRCQIWKSKTLSGKKDKEAAPHEEELLPDQSTGGPHIIAIGMKTFRMKGTPDQVDQAVSLRPDESQRQNELPAPDLY